MANLIDREAAIETAFTYLVEYCGSLFDEDMQKALKERLESLPSAQTEGISLEWIDKHLEWLDKQLTDCVAIEHLCETGWMQNHDKEMYEAGLRERLADDSDSYDSLIPSAQPDYHEVLGWLLAYHTKSFDLHGRYLPHEVIYWLINDFTRVFITEREHDE